MPDRFELEPWQQRLLEAYGVPPRAVTQLSRAPGPYKRRPVRDDAHADRLIDRIELERDDPDIIEHRRGWQ